MIEVLISALNGQGIWTVCCVCLTVFVLKTSGEREVKLQDIIDKLTDKLEIMDDVQKDVDEIKVLILTNQEVK